MAAPSALPPLLSTHLEEYTYLCFLHKIGKRNRPEYPVALHVGDIVQAEMLAGGLAEAFNNQVTIDIDIDWYAKSVGSAKCQDEKEATLARDYNKLKKKPYPVYTSPTLFVDKWGRVVTWYVPAIWADRSEFLAWDALTPVVQLLEKSVKDGSDWRVKRKYFFKNVPAGCMNLSPAWFQQGRNLHTGQLEISSQLRDVPKAQEWVSKMGPIFDIINAASRVIHPEQHSIAREAMNRLRQNPSILRDPTTAPYSVEPWTSVFSAVAIVLNRRTPPHRDSQSATHGLDIMLTLGEYSSAFMCLEPLGVELLYNTGTLVAISGPLIRHSVVCREPGRLCLAFYMREAVHEKLGVPRIAFNHVSRYV